MAIVKLRQPKKQKSYLGPIVAVGIAGGTALGILLPDSSVDFAADKVNAIGLNPNCRIKGNISINTDERIYHVPGQEFYRETNISPEYGERYFCTESDARRAGWRKARR